MANLANEATDASETNGANKADGGDNSNKADKAEANNANDAKADEANEAIATKEVNEAIEPMFRQGQQVDEANDAKADETNKAIGAGVSIKVVDSDIEDEVLDNQLTKIEKLDASNAAIVSNEAGELSELAMTSNNKLIVAGSDELDEFVEADEAV